MEWYIRYPIFNFFMGDEPSPVYVLTIWAYPGAQIRRFADVITSPRVDSRV